MVKKKIFLVITLFAGMIFSGFQCSSTELTSARLYIQQKNYDKAIDVLKKDVEKNPKSDEGWFLLGHTYGELGNMDSMLTGYSNSLAASNKFEQQIIDSKNYYWANSFNSGVNLFQRGNDTADEDSSKIFYDKSIEAFENAAMIQPDSADVYKNIAFVYMSSGENEKAIEPLQQLVKLNQELDGYKYLGEIYYALGSNKISSYRISGNAQDSVDANGHFSDAIDILEKGRSNYPDNDDLTRILNASYIEMGRITEALESSKALVDKEPENKTYRYNYGVILLQSEKYESAEEQFKKALEIDPDYDNAIYNLAVTYVSWGTQMSKEAEENEDFSGEYKKKYEAAMPYLERVVAVDTENAEIWELLGKVYSVLGMQDKAIEAFNNADRLR
jgi:tetratricopeptide (TPR) repeat protein